LLIILEELELGVGGEALLLPRVGLLLVKLLDSEVRFPILLDLLGARKRSELQRQSRSHGGKECLKMMEA